MGRHYAPGDPAAEKPRGRNVARLLVGAALVAVLVAGLVAIVGGRFAGCGEQRTVTVLADPALAPAIRSQAALASGTCTTLAVSEAPDREAAGRLASGAADLWIAPSRLRADAVSAQLGRELPTTVVAGSPIVLAGAAVPQPASWAEAMTQATIRAVPADSPYAEAPVAAAVAEASRPGGSDDQALNSVLAQYAQAAKRVSGDPVAAAAADGGVVAVPEYAYLAEKKTRGDLAALVPKSGAPRDELLLAVAATGDRKAAATDAGERLAGAFTSDDGRAALARDGLRGTTLAEAPSGGVGAVTALPDPDRSRLTRAEQTYSTLAVPLKALVVVDTSGSMDEKVGDTTRIGMLASGFTKVVTQIPDANAVGLWTFALATNGGKDWTEVVPTARLSDKRGDKTQRQALLDGVNSLPGRVRGGTGLYDTTLAAYRQAVKDFDPAYSNSLILLTDGGNEKDGGTTLDQLVAELRKLVDPARPVNIHTVGISKDADLPALKKIADATGGTAQSADTEQQMLADFVNAVAKRAK
ncbi:VWA domain-containing protein [Tsukamurella paurometabola]|uniref:von Willebrand factor type A domain n=1 Tax=Tsukamurella paurometabola TaxID=2061 RepID=A0A3P8JW80_TSUPA|nr:VWA domain-containing protein [Tsukamurella paurometabola]UEA85000.1 VWA domain-containing protein [Tsukamurella paurometabola]VDR37599.1 von Willebrand factor type A domain [Tsukamurella paurometabola]